MNLCRLVGAALLFGAGFLFSRSELFPRGEEEEKRIGASLSLVLFAERAITEARTPIPSILQTLPPEVTNILGEVPKGTAGFQDYFKTAHLPEGKSREALLSFSRDVGLSELESEKRILAAARTVLLEEYTKEREKAARGVKTRQALFLGALAALLILIL